MNTIAIELKKIYFSERMSEETNAFTADIYVDGKKAGYAKNDGCGGSTYYHSYPKCNSLIEMAETYCKQLPAIDLGDGISIENNLENFIDDLLDKYLIEKDKIKFQKKLEKDCLKGICYGNSNNLEYRVIHWNGDWTIEKLLKTPKGYEVLEKKVKELINNGETILNTNLPF